MARILSSEDLSWFANHFMLDFAKTCIAIENFSNETYPCFYVGFWEYFKSFLSQRKNFDINNVLQGSHEHFHSLIKDYIPSDCKEGTSVPLGSIPTSGTKCIEHLNELRKLEER